MLSDLSVDVHRYPEIQKALTTGEVVLVRDAPSDPLYEGMTSIETRSTLVLPFSLGGQRAGVFFLRTGEGDPPLGETDLRFAARVVDSAVSAIEKAREREESVRGDGETRAADTDPLTGLLNGEALEGRMAWAVELASRSGASLTCLLVRLDDLKRLPVTHGGRTGDRVLTQFAQLLRREQRAVDIVARSGEDEFAMLLPDTGAPGARLFAERILRQAEQTAFGEPGASVTLTVNVGLATYPGEQSRDAASLLELAGKNLLRARSDGGNSYRD